MFFPQKGKVIKIEKKYLNGSEETGKDTSRISMISWQSILTDNCKKFLSDYCIPGIAVVLRETVADTKELVF